MPAGSGQLPEVPRALCLTPEDRGVIVGRLARAVLRFQDEFLCRESSPAGLLCQVWLPDVVEGNQIVLKTKGMPFCVAGMGDLLALFRCISCRFAFGTNVAKPATLGAPGRVFTSSEPEMCCNVQQYGKQQYLRRAEAEQCQVQSTLLLPLFISPNRSGCVGVLEVVQTSQDMRFADVAALLSAALEQSCELYTCGLDAVHRRLPSMTHTTLLLPPNVGVLEAPPSSDQPPHGSEGDGSLNRGASGGEGKADGGARGGRGGSGGSEQDSEDLSMADDDDYDDDDEEETGGRRKGGSRAHRSRRRAGLGNPGKPGVRLTLEDLQSHFGVGLKEAANRLGICPTTLKRACRRHGIQRWPRRQLQKVNKALDELEARQMMQPQQHLAGNGALGSGALGSGGYGADAGGGLPPADTRWTTLARFIPAYQGGLGGGMPGFQGQGSMPFAVSVQQTAPMGSAAAHQVQALALAQVQQQQQQQQQQQLYMQQQAAQQAAQQAPSSAFSLPDGALAMRGSASGAAMQEVSLVSGVSSLGQPPPQGGARPATTTAAAPPQRQGSGGVSVRHLGGAPSFVSPFSGGAPVGGAARPPPVVSLPGGAGGGQAATRGLSTISVPSVGADIMPPLGGTGASALTDDDQVGFLDSSVLELLLNEDQRGGARAPGAAGGGESAGPPPDMGPLGSLNLPGLSGISNGGLSFML